MAARSSSHAPSAAPTTATKNKVSSRLYQYFSEKEKNGQTFLCKGKSPLEILEARAHRASRQSLEAARKIRGVKMTQEEEKKVNGKKIGERGHIDGFTSIELEEVFAALDSDADRTISVRELTAAMRLLGLKFTHDELKFLVDDVAAAGTGELSIQQFMSLAIYHRRFLFVSRKVKRPTSSTARIGDAMAKIYILLSRQGQQKALAAALAHARLHVDQSGNWVKSVQCKEGVDCEPESQLRKLVWMTREGTESEMAV